MTNIHPTAIVDQGAELGEDVQIGPYCIVTDDVRLGDRTELVSMVRIEQGTTIGADCRCFHGASIGTEPQDLKFKGGRSEVRIGDRNTFREFCTVNRATDEGEATAIGNDCLIMSYAHVAHNCIVGNNVILANSANLAGHVIAGDYVIVGGVTPVHQFVNLGAHCMIGGGCRVPKDVPPYVQAAGHPLKIFGLNSIGLMRRGFSSELVDELKKMYKLFFRSNLVTEKAMEKIRTECAPSPEIELFCQFIEGSERGITR